MRICKLWKQYEVEAVQFAVDRGHSLNEVSVILGRTVKSISTYIRGNQMRNNRIANPYTKNLKLGVR